MGPGMRSNGGERGQIEGNRVRQGGTGLDKGEWGRTRD